VEAGQARLDRAHERRRRRPPGVERELRVQITLRS
jgi:hypothetical protein